MAQHKKSFILYADLITTVENLPDNKAGKLFKTILQYVNDRNPDVDDLLLKIAFEPIKQQLKRDLQQWESERAKRSDAGRTGGKKSGEARRSKTKQNEAKQSSASKNEANEADNVTVTVTVNDTVTDSVNVKEIEGESRTVFFDGEELILKNRLWFEAVLMKTGFALDEGLICLKKFHLHKQEKDGYPASKKQILAGFEKWLMNERQFNPQSAQTKTVVPKSDPSNVW